MFVTTRAAVLSEVVLSVRLSPSSPLPLSLLVFHLAFPLPAPGVGRASRRDLTSFFRGPDSTPVFVRSFLPAHPLSLPPSHQLSLPEMDHSLAFSRFSGPRFHLFCTASPSSHRSSSPSPLGVLRSMTLGHAVPFRRSWKSLRLTGNNLWK